MRLKPHNIAILIFAIVIAFLLLWHGHEVSGVLDDLSRIGPGHTNDETTVGLLALGFIGVSLVAIVKLLTRNPPEDRQDRRRDPPED